MEVPIKDEKQILLDAVSEIEARTWCQGRLQAVYVSLSDPEGTKPGAVCLVGAMRMSAFKSVLFNPAHPNYTPYLNAQYEVAKTIGLTKRDGLSNWNDAHKRTKEEVISVLKAAAEKF